MTYYITSRRGTSKLLELVPNPFDDINKNVQNTTKSGMWKEVKILSTSSAQNKRRVQLQTEIDSNG